MMASNYKCNNRLAIINNMRIGRSFGNGCYVKITSKVTDGSQVANADKVL